MAKGYQRMNIDKTLAEIPWITTKRYHDPTVRALCLLIEHQADALDTALDHIERMDAQHQAAVDLAALFGALVATG